MIHRRTLLKGIIAAPAIIAIERLMPVKLWVPPQHTITGVPKVGEILTVSQGQWREVDINRALYKFCYVDKDGPHSYGPYTYKDIVEKGLRIAHAA